jgi:hypothetical protein
MKKKLFLYILVLICFDQTAIAQLKSSSLHQRKQLPMPFPDKLVKPASTFIMSAHIPDVKKPLVVSLPDMQDFVSNVLAHCPSYKNPEPTIMLNAQRVNNFIADLKWETKYAFKASGFRIERSLADTLHFTTVNFKQAVTSQGLKKNYHLPDNNHYNGISFYRIKQFNADTTYLYSNMVSVEGYSAISFRIYPNPASEKIWIELISNLNGNASIILYDASGKIMQQHTLNCSKNIPELKSLNINKFANGVYQVKIFLPDKTFLTGKFLKE